MSGLMNIVVLSGKGGVGKSSVVSAIAKQLSKYRKIVLADADVDCPNQHILFKGSVYEENMLYLTETAVMSGYIKNLDQGICRFGAIREGSVDVSRCTGCGACTITYPDNFKLEKKLTGRLIVRKTAEFPLVYGKLEPGESGSGKLVHSIRKKAEKFAGNPLILIDAPAGIGCPVVAAITGCDRAVCIVEPTPASISALERAISTLNHFSIPYDIIVNKEGISQEYSERINDMFKEKILARVPYDEEIPRLLANAIVPSQGSGRGAHALRKASEVFSAMMED